jgi:hypothetical protein
MTAQTGRQRTRRQRRAGGWAAAGAALLTVTVPWSWGGPASAEQLAPAQSSSSRSSVSMSVPVSMLSAAQVLTGVAVKGRAPKTGYARSQFGDGWIDADHDGCSTREEILQRDLTRTTYRRSGRCQVIVTGLLAEPYSGKTMTFTRGTTTSALVQIDHVVALADAWQKGAQGMSLARRIAFANDPLNLLAVNGKLNFAKGASDAATWLPPNKAYRCRYVARQVAVKARYGLWMTAAEKAAAGSVLATCPGQKVPTG